VNGVRSRCETFHFSGTHTTSTSYFATLEYFKLNISKLNIRRRRLLARHPEQTINTLNNLSNSDDVRLLARHPERLGDVVNFSGEVGGEDARVVGAEGWKKKKVGVQSELRCYGVTVSAVSAVDTVKMYLMSQCTRIYFARIYFATLNVSI
jgi:hypothetical protein